MEDDYLYDENNERVTPNKKHVCSDGSKMYLTAFAGYTNIEHNKMINNHNDEKVPQERCKGRTFYDVVLEGSVCPECGLYTGVK